MKETDMFPPIRDWLRGMGFDVYVEVAHWGRSVDVVGRRGDMLCCVEMKMSFNDVVLYQSYYCRLITPFSYIAVASMPRTASINATRMNGVGLLTVKGGTVDVLVEPDLDDTTNKRYSEKICLRNPNTGIAGHPTLKGIGPRIDCAARVEKYLKEHPKAKWKEVFDKVDNHYSTHNSMASAMRSYSVLLYVPDEIAFRPAPLQTNMDFLENK